MNPRSHPRVDGADARRIGVLQALEDTGGDPLPPWTVDDRAWATRMAREASGVDAPPERFLAARARHAHERLRERGSPLAAADARPPRTAAWALAASAVGFAAGIAIDQIGATQRINLLAPPVWVVIAWNVAVYIGLLLSAPARRRPRGWLRRLFIAAGLSDAPSGSPTRRVAERMAELTLPAQLARAAGWLHLAAAACGAGLVAGLYLRGLVLDYRAGWESTFLDAPTVHAWLSVLLHPASLLTGIAIPGPDALTALRVEAGAAATGDAAPWLHLYAATLAIVVIAPRLLLAAIALWRAGRRARRVALPLHEPYFQRLLRERTGRRARVHAVACGWAPDAQVAAGLRAWLAREYGDDVELPPIETVDDTSDAPAPRPAGEMRPDLAVVLCNLATTPEDEVHGRALGRLVAAAAPVPVMVLIDESSFLQRFRMAPQRLSQRRQAWREFGLRHAVSPVFAELAPRPSMPAAGT